MEEKRFGEWIELKSKLHFEKKAPRFTDGEVWWCGMGENVGVEINGKNKMFARPVVIFRKLSALSFMGIPLTSQPKSGTWYTEFKFLGKRQWAVLCQAKVISVSRLYNKMGRLPETDLQKIREDFIDLYGKNTPPTLQKGV